MGASLPVPARNRTTQNQAIMFLAMMVLLALFFLGLLCYILWDWAAWPPVC